MFATFIKPRVLIAIFRRRGGKEVVLRQTSSGEVQRKSDITFPGRTLDEFLIIPGMCTDSKCPPFAQE